MDILKATHLFERWLGTNLDLVPSDLRRKHKAMSASCFSFFRATCYRWAQVWPKVCPKLEAAPVVLGVGDLHIENFGTWRDIEGRLVWGVNDFDEACPLPYTADLVRLVVSVGLAKRESNIGIDLPVACRTLLRGYRQGLESDGRPFVLADTETPLRAIARHRLKDPRSFWKKLTGPKEIAHLPRRARRLLLRALDPLGHEVHFVPRVAGLGSLGHQRFVGWTLRHGAKIAREAKARSPSSWLWTDQKLSDKDYARKLLSRAVRCPDPTLDLTSRWLLRRLAPDCCRFELADLPMQRDEQALLWCMGKETANIHLGAGQRSSILRHLNTRFTPAVLARAASSMTQATADDWDQWKKLR